MTKIRYTDLGNNQIQLEIKGHAGYNPGNDIVCASISTLVGVLARTVEKEGGYAEIEEGRALAILPRGTITDIVLDLFLDLVEDYPNCVQLEKINSI